MRSAKGEPLKDWDFTRFNPEFWKHFEQRVQDLLNLGIEADIILFHTYDRWDFENMDAESDDRYIRYAVARLAAFRNVWWSLANEFDIMPAKQESDWDRFFQTQRATRQRHPSQSMYPPKHPLTSGHTQHSLARAMDSFFSGMVPLKAVETLNPAARRQSVVRGSWT